MIQVTKVIEWDMGHRVPNHKNKCRNPHGHRYRLELTVFGELNMEKGSSSEGMVVDFGDIKQIMLERIHNVVDHTFMAFEGDPLARVLGEHGHVLLVPFIPTAENIAKWCYERVRSHFPPGVSISNCRIFETPNSWADYRIE